MIKYRFDACKHLTSDILQRTYIQNKNERTASYQLSMEKKNKPINIIFMFLKIAKVVIVKFLSIIHILVNFYSFVPYENSEMYIGIV